MPARSVLLFLGYASFKDVLAKYVKKKKMMLDVGCGSSRLGEDLLKDGYKSVRCVDSCAVVVNQMKAKYASLPPGTLIYQVDNILTLEGYGDASVDTAIAKGSFDALLTQKYSREMISLAVKSLHRVLKPKGILFVISHSEARAALFPPNAWKVTMHKIEAPRVNDVTPDDPYYYLYACAKNEL